MSDPDLLRYVVARVVSFAGSAVTFIAMPVLIYGMTGSAGWTSLVIATEGIPYLLFGLWAGAVADHIDRRRMMVVADLAAAVALSTVPLAAWFGALTAPHVLAVAFATRTIFVFFDAANQGALPSLVPRDRLPSANAMVFGSSTAVETVVPMITGALIVLVSPASIIAIDVLTFVASALLVRGILRPLSALRDPDATIGAGAIVKGMRFIAGHEVVRLMIVIGTLVAFSGGSLMAVLVVWADRALGVREGDWRLGVLYGAWGAGAVIGSLLVPRLVQQCGGVRAVLLTLPLAATAGLAIPAAGNWLPAVLGLAAWSSTYIVIATGSVTLRQQVTPEPLMSRVMVAGRIATFGAGFPAGAFAAGLLANYLDIGRVIWICQLSLVLAAGIGWMSSLRSAPKVLPVADFG